MSAWVRHNIGTLITALALLLATAASWGRMALLCDQMDAKADKSAIVRELDQIHTSLQRIEGKVDGIARKP